jgi:hypothetical protein
VDEFIATVLLNSENKPTELLTFANSIEEAIDNMVLLEAVRFLCQLKRIKDSKVWDFDEELQPLREIRRMVRESAGEVSMRLSLKEE